MKKYYIILGWIQILIAIGAIPAGLVFLFDTSGSGMGTSVAMLENSPLKSFLIPGLFLFIVHGLGNAAGAILSFRKSSLAGKTAFVLGILMCLWIIIQIYWIGLSSFMQSLFMTIGLAEASFAWIILRKTARNLQ
jgi:hypothetical protein